MQAYIRNGWSTNLCDPDKMSTSGTSATGNSSGGTEPPRDWQLLKQTFIGKSPDELFAFNNANIINYFVVRTTVDGKPANDTKAMNSSALALFGCGHVQDIEMCYDNHLCLRASCLPEMRKDRVYKLLLLLDSKSSDILQAECGCPGGKGPFASCKHIGALCYAIEEFCRLGSTPDFLTCTEKLQQWNIPRPKRLPLIPVCDLSSRRHEILQKEKKGTSLNAFIPRPLEHRQYDASAVEQLRCDLLSLSQPCAFLHILVPSLSHIHHDHTYSQLPTEDLQSIRPLADRIPSGLPSFPMNEELKAACNAKKASLTVSREERESIEKETRNQSSNIQWHIIRAHRITGSKCGKNLSQKTKSVSLLVNCLYEKPISHLPPPISSGCQYKSVAIDAYIAHMNSLGNHGISVKKCGFIIHPVKGWIGASPDGRVTDLTANKPLGLIEVKYPYTKREMTPMEAYKYPNFYCKVINDRDICLKPNHPYYHQVQLQLYAGSGTYHWCDFCIYTKKGISVQRIFPDFEWQHVCIPELESFFDSYVAPELVLSLYKPRYIL